MASTSTDRNGSTRSPLQRPMKEELSDSDDIPSILCKKVRQAQQTKGIWVQPNKQPSQLVIMVPASPQNDTAMDVSGNTQLMRPPKYNHTHSRVAQSNATPFASISEPYNTKKSVAAAAIAAATAASTSALAASSMPQRTNRNRNIPHTAVSRADAADDDVTTNIIMPRERVISICNLDKDALDGYLIGGDNSQDQEAELLKYFQPEDGSSAVATAVSESTNAVYDYTVNMKQNITSSSILENYQLCSNDDTSAPTYSKFGKKPCYDKGQISELRYYLQSNFANQQNDPAFQATSGGSKVNNNDTSLSGNYLPASTALSMISNRLIRDKEYLKLPNAGATVLGAKEKRATGFADVNATTTNSNNIPQSPNSRRKNFSFVPISPGPQSPRTSSFTFAHQSGGTSTESSVNPFVSPRATSATQRHKTIRFNNIGSSMAPTSGLHQTFNSSSVGTGPSDFRNVHQFKEEVSISAPPSPSSHSFRMTNDRTSAITTASISFPATKLHDQHTSDGSMENRSQSAPLHYHMPKSSTYKLNVYSSASNSVAQTPVPADYSDFSDGSSFIDLLESPGSTTNIKMETGDILPGLLDSDLSVRLAEMVPDLNVRQLGSMSRSVPSTPQPLFSGHQQHQQPHQQRRGIDQRQHKSFDMSKSVPTTPIGMQGTPFRYSPEHNRDFLINGNTIETGQLASFYQHRQQHNMTQQQHHETVLSDKELPIAEEIDELSAFGEDADPIIGSDLLNNL